MFYITMELLVFATIIFLGITQVIIPLWNDRPLFPLLRKKNRELRQGLTMSREDVDQAETEQAIKVNQNQAAYIRSPKPEKEGGE